MPVDRVLLAAEWFLKYTATLAGGMQEHGRTVALLSRDIDLEFGGVPGEMRRWVDRRVQPGTEHLVLPGRVREVGRLADVVRLRRRVRAFAPDAVHVQDSLVHDLRLAAIAGLRPGRYALTVHDPVPHPGDPVPTARIRRARRLLRRNAGLIFVHAEALRDELVAADAPPAPVVVVPHGVERHEPQPLPERPQLLFFGRISHYKGLDVLLDAMPRVWEYAPEVTLTIAGEGAIEPRPALDDERVTVRNGHIPHEDLPGLLAAATCLVLPYRQASQSGVALRAREHGRAVVATTVGGIPEAVPAGTGRLVAPEDPAALAEAVLDVATTPGRAAEMGRAAWRLVDEVSWERVAGLTLEAYERHLTGSRRRPLARAPR